MISWAELCSPKKSLTRVSKPVSGVHGKRGLERGWQTRLAKGWRRVGGLPCTLQFCNSRGARLEDRVGYQRNVHHHHRKKIIWRLCWPQRKTFEVGGRYKKPIKPGKPCLSPKSFLCGPHFFRQRKVPHWSRAVYALFFSAPSHRTVSRPKVSIFVFL